MVQNFELTCATQWITGDGWYSFVCRYTTYFGGRDGGTSWVHVVMSVMACVCAVISLRKEDAKLIHIYSYTYVYHLVTLYTNHYTVF